MAESASAAPLAAAAPKGGAFRTYEEGFTQSPDPWMEIIALVPGGDRTFASTVQRIVIAAEPAQRPALETKLLTALAQPALTDESRMFVCRMLAFIGSERCVPALLALLSAAATSDAARYALEQISGPAATTALREALDKLSGAPKAGLIGAIALRGDTTVVPALERIATNESEPALVRAAAARAVARLHAPVS